ncbi:MAG: NAD+ synthase [archaeon]|nr:NAD+ synthase [archaeon]
MKVAMAQIDTIAGDLEANTQKIILYIKKARKEGADMVVFPEMCLSGYPASDLLFEEAFLEEQKKKLDTIALECKGLTAVIGFVDFNKANISEDGSVKKYNSAMVITNGTKVGVQSKKLLPTYNVFDEKRYFSFTHESNIFYLKGKKFGVTICEDLWDKNYSLKPIRALLDKGAEIIVNISASPFHFGRFAQRMELFSGHTRNGCSVVFVNKVGCQDNGNDILVFDGQSMAFNERGQLVGLAGRFTEEMVVADLNSKSHVDIPKFSYDEEVYNALVFSLKDYAQKSGFGKAVIGLSGGIDSSLCACIAVEALGKKNVLGVALPGKNNSPQSAADAKELAKKLGIEFREWDMNAQFEGFEKDFSKNLKAKLKGTALENLQPRLRMAALMGLSNSEERLLIGTGNKTEIALGYCTLYGDMTGGLEVIGDISKQNVYRLAKYASARLGNAISEKIFSKAPSAELAPKQKDPFDYEKVSPIVDLIVEKNYSVKMLKEEGHNKQLSEKTKAMVDAAQFKRKQAPPIIRVTERSFGAGRVYPIINKWN